MNTRKVEPIDRMATLDNMTKTILHNIDRDADSKMHERHSISMSIMQLADYRRLGKLKFHRAPAWMDNEWERADKRVREASSQIVKSDHIFNEGACYVENALLNIPTPTLYMWQEMSEDGSFVYHVLEGAAVVHALTFFTLDVDTESNWPTTFFRDLSKSTAHRYWLYELCVEVIQEPTIEKAMAQLTRVHTRQRAARIECTRWTEPTGPLRVYVAGASKEAVRCRAMMTAVEALGCKQTLDWLKEIEMAGAANEGLTDEQRRYHATNDINAVLAADVIIVLAPEKAASTGVWTELGVALAANRYRAHYPIKILVAGSIDARTKSIFASHALVEFDEDAALLNAFTGAIRSRWLMLGHP